MTARQAPRRRAGVGLAVLGLVALALPVGARAVGPGDLDPSFGHDGKRIAPLDGDLAASAVAVYENGKFIVAGTRYTAPNNDIDGAEIFIARFRSDGRLDRSFGERGRVTVAIGEGAFASAIALQPDGKVVVGGGIRDPSPACCVERLALVRLNEDGSLDESFGSDGIVTSSLEAATDFAIQPDGRILAALDTEASDPAVARFLADGSLDPSFSADGLAVGSPSATWRSLTLLPDGRIAVGGEIRDVGGYDLVLALYGSDGELEPTFSEDGILTEQGPFPTYRAWELEATSEGDLVVLGGGCSGDPAGTCAAVASRYAPNGVLDPLFGKAGFFRPPRTATDPGEALAVQPDGKVLIAGTYLNRTLVLSRLDQKGDLDRGFSKNGQVSVSMGSALWPTAATLQSPNRLLVAGYVSTPKRRVALLRFKLGRGGGKTP